jgi:hypothetical protein
MPKPYACNAIAETAPRSASLAAGEYQGTWNRCPMTPKRGKAQRKAAKKFGKNTD